MGISLTPEERFEVFGEWSPEEHADEVEERWGNTEAYSESRRRVSTYTKEDWLKIKAEAADIDQEFAAALRAGVEPESETGMDLAERHRQHITRYFYDCSYEIHRGLAEMFVADPRFRDRYQAIAPGLAEFVTRTMRANAERAGSSTG